MGGCEQADSEWRREFMPNGSMRVVSRKGSSSMKVAGESMPMAIISLRMSGKIPFRSSSISER